MVISGDEMAKDIERLCDRMSEMRRKIDERKTELLEFQEEAESDDRKCSGKVEEIKQKLEDLNDELDSILEQNPSTENQLEELLELQGKVEDVEELICETDKLIDGSLLAKSNRNKDNVTAASSKAERLKWHMTDRIGELTRIKKDKSKVQNAIKKVRNFMKAKTMQLQNSSKGKIERQLSEVNRCCLEIENESRILLSPVGRAKGVAEELGAEERRILDEEIGTMMKVWNDFQSDAKKVQTRLAQSYKQKVESMGEIKGEIEVLKNFQSGVQNFQITDLMSLVECEEELSDFFDGFKKKEKKLQKIFEKAEGILRPNFEDDLSELSNLSTEAQTLKDQIKFDLQEKQHRFETSLKRFNSLLKTSKDKGLFIESLRDQVKGLETIDPSNMETRDQLNVETIDGQVDDLTKIQHTIDEVRNEVKALCENLINARKELPETEADHCEVIMDELSSSWENLQFLANTQRENQTLKRIILLKIANIEQGLLKFNRSHSDNQGDTNLEAIERRLSENEQVFSGINSRNALTQKEVENLSSKMNQEDRDEISRKMSEVLKMRDSIAEKLRNERSHIGDINERKMLFEKEIDSVLEELQSIEDAGSKFDARIVPKHRLDYLGSLDAHLDSLESKLSNMLEDAGLMSLLPVEEQDQFKRQLGMFNERAASCKESLGSQLRYLNERMELKNKAEANLRGYVEEIEQAGECGPQEMKLEQLERIEHDFKQLETDISSLSNIFEGTPEFDSLSSLFDDAKNRISSLKQKALVKDIKEDSGKELPSTDFESEEIIEAVTVREVESQAEGSELFQGLPEDEIALPQEYQMLQAETAVNADSDSDYVVINVINDTEEENLIPGIRKRINEHSKRIKEMDTQNNALSNEVSLENCIAAISKCLETVSHVMDDIPKLCSELESYSTSAKEEETAQLISDVKDLEKICKSTRESLLKKNEACDNLRLESVGYAEILKEIISKLASIESVDLKDIAIEKSEELKVSVDEKIKIVASAKTAIMQGEKRTNFLETLPEEETLMLLQQEESLNNGVVVAENNLEKDKAVVKKIAVLAEIRELDKAIQFSFQEVNDLKDKEMTADVIQKVRTAQKRVVEYQHRAGTLKETALIPCELLSGEEATLLTGTVEELTQSVEELCIEFNQGAEKLQKSQQAIHLMQLKVDELNALVENADQNCEKILAAEDMESIISLLGDSVQEINNVAERIPVVYTELSNVACDLEADQVESFKGQVESAAKKSFQTRLKLTGKSDEIEEAEKLRRNVNDFIEDSGEELAKMDEKLQEIVGIEDLDDMHDFLIIQEMNMQEMAGKLYQEVNLFQESKGSGLLFHGKEQLENNVREIQDKIKESSANLAGVQAFVQKISKVMEKGGLSVQVNCDEIEASVDLNVSLEDQVLSGKHNSKGSALQKSLNRLSKCQDELDGFEQSVPDETTSKVACRLIGEIAASFKKRVEVAKEATKQALQHHQDQVTIEQVISSVKKIEAQLQEVQAFCQESFLEDDRAKEKQKTAVQLHAIAEFDKTLREAVFRLGSVQGEDVGKEDVLKRCEEAIMTCCASKEKLVIKEQKLQDIERAISKRKSMLEKITGELEALCEDGLCNAGSGESELETRKASLEQKKRSLNLMKSRLEHVASQNQEIFKAVPENEKLKLEEEIEKQRERTDELEEKIDSEIEETKRVMDVKSKLIEMDGTNEVLQGIFDQLEERKSGIDPSVLEGIKTSFQKKLEELQPDILFLISNGEEKYKGIVTQLGDMQEKIETLVSNIEQRNEGYLEANRRLKELSKMLKAAKIDCSDEYLNETSLSQQIKVLEDCIQSNREIKEKISTMEETLQGLSGNVAEDKYKSVFAYLENVKTRCEIQMAKDFAKLDEIVDDQYVTEGFLEKMNEIGFQVMKIEPRKAVKYDTEELDVAMNTVNEDQSKMNVVEEQISQELEKMEGYFDKLPEEERNQIAELKCDVEAKMAHAKAAVSQGKSELASKCSIMERFAKLDAEIQELETQTNGQLCSDANDGLQDNISAVEGKVVSLQDELQKCQESFYNPDLFATDELMKHTERIEFLAEILNNVLDDNESLANAIQMISKISKSLDYLETDFAAERQLKQMRTSEREGVLQAALGKICGQEELLVEMKSSLYQFKSRIEVPTYERLLTNISSKQSGIGEERELLKEKLSDCKCLRDEVSHYESELMSINDDLNELVNADTSCLEIESCNKAILSTERNLEALEIAENRLKLANDKLESLEGQMPKDQYGNLDNSLKDVMTRTDALIAANNESRSYLEYKINIIEKIKQLRQEVDNLNSEAARIDVTSKDGHERFMIARESIQSVEKTLADLDDAVAGSCFEKEFQEKYLSDVETVKENILTLQSAVGVKIDSGTKARADIKYVEESLNDITKSMSKVSEREIAHKTEIGSTSLNDGVSLDEHCKVNENEAADCEKLDAELLEMQKVVESVKDKLPESDISIISEKLEESRGKLQERKEQLLSERQKLIKMQELEIFQKKVDGLNQRLESFDIASKDGTNIETMRSCLSTNSRDIGEVKDLENEIELLNNFDIPGIELIEVKAKISSLKATVVEKSDWFMKQQIHLQRRLDLITSIERVRDEVGKFEDRIKMIELQASVEEIESIYAGTNEGLEDIGELQMQLEKLSNISAGDRNILVADIQQISDQMKILNDVVKLLQEGKGCLQEYEQLHNELVEIDDSEAFDEIRDEEMLSKVIMNVNKKTETLEDSDSKHQKLTAIIEGTAEALPGIDLLQTMEFFADLKYGLDLETERMRDKRARLNQIRDILINHEKSTEELKRTLGGVDRVNSDSFDEKKVIEEIVKAEEEQEILNDVKMRLNEMKEAMINSSVPLPSQLESKLREDIESSLQEASSLESEIQSVKGILEEKKTILNQIKKLSIEAEDCERRAKSNYDVIKDTEEADSTIKQLANIQTSIDTLKAKIDSLTLDDGNGEGTLVLKELVNLKGKAKETQDRVTKKQTDARNLLEKLEKVKEDDKNNEKELDRIKGKNFNISFRNPYCDPL